MSRQLSEWPTKRHGNSLHPWDQWMDGNIWEIKQEEDFSCKATTMRSYLHGQAQRKNTKVRVTLVDEKTLVFQFQDGGR